MVCREIQPFQESATGIRILGEGNEPGSLPGVSLFKIYIDKPKVELKYTRPYEISHVRWGWFRRMVARH
jgi:hypothetical protein